VVFILVLLVKETDTSWSYKLVSEINNNSATLKITPTKSRGHTAACHMLNCAVRTHAKMCR